MKNSWTVLHKRWHWQVAAIQMSGWIIYHCYLQLELQPGLPVLHPKSYQSHEWWSRSSDEKGTEWNCLIYGSIPAVSSHHYRNIAMKTHLSTASNQLSALTQQSHYIPVKSYSLNMFQINNYLFSVTEIQESTWMPTHECLSNLILDCLKIMFLDSSHPDSTCVPFYSSGRRILGHHGQIVISGPFGDQTYSSITEKSFICMLLPLPGKFCGWI